MIASMTAFARCFDRVAGGEITWEIKSVNHRYLDCSFYLPEQFRRLELDLREKIKQKIQRGRVECKLWYKGGANGVEMKVNVDLVKKLSRVSKELAKAMPGVKGVSMVDLLRWPDVLQVCERGAEEVNVAIFKLFDAEIEQFLASRIKEGEVLRGFLLSRLDKIVLLIGKVKENAPKILSLQREKLLARLHDFEEQLDPTRLEQEILLFSHKVDIAEEIDRLGMHVEEMRQVLNAGTGVGKRLDFLLQELNREANTLASKSVDVEITQIAVEVKVLIEEMREQVQNIE